MSSFAPGTVLRGKYRVDRVLGRGGMGVVLSAWHVALQQRVAIKVLSSALAAHPEAIARFLREARAASKLEGDHVVRIMDVDTLDDGSPFLVMEHLEGADLSRIRKEKRPLPVHVAVDYVLQIAAAIAEAHGLGIIHRDLKPANVFLAQRRDGTTRIKVLDFGISKVLADEPSGEVGLTAPATVMGSVEYMSPEQMISARDVDARTDIWALGVILYELSTAHVPFPGQSLVQVSAIVMTQPPPPPRSYRAEIPDGLEAVILRCLEKDREKRFASVPELMSALTPYRSAGTTILSGPAVVVPTVDPAAVAVTAPHPDEGADHPTQLLPEPRTISAVATPSPYRPPVRAWWPYALAGIALLAGSIGLGQVLRKDAPGDARPAMSAAASAAATPAPVPEPVVVLGTAAPSASATAVTSASAVTSVRVVAAPVRSAAPRSTAAPALTLKPSARVPGHTID
ncbi:MAG: serine/threonine-protein kinase [Byssovorax sp.]